MGFFEKTFAKAKNALGRIKSKFDKGGSYTGAPSDGTSEPEQDADDL
ncbi:MAG: hypothetical protein K5753_02115 [Clostridia bacterium]|nr:hypothetical protein [Clostridia bacterium]